MKRVLLLLAFLFPQAASAATDPQVLDYLRRLQDAYYTFSGAGLQRFECDMAVQKDSADLIPGTPSPYTMTWRGGGLVPTLDPRPGLAPADAEVLKATQDLLGGFLMMWGGLCSAPLFGDVTDCTLGKDPDGAFRVRVPHEGSFITVFFDPKAIAYRMSIPNGADFLGVGMGFRRIDKGWIVDRLELAGNTLRIEYAPQGRYLLPSRFTLTLPKMGERFDLIPSQYRINGQGDAVAPPPAPVGLKLIPNASLPPGAKHFFWRVRSATSTVYLLGSVHMRPNTPLEVPEFVESCFAASHYVGFESDLGKMDGLKAEIEAFVKEKLIYPEGDGLDKHLTPEDWESVVAACAKVGLPDFSAARMKPVLLSLTLSVLATQKKGLSQESGIDHIFLQKAKASNKPTFGLEFWKEPMEMLASMPMKDQVTMLLGSFKEQEHFLNKTDGIEEAWARGDTAFIERLILETPMAPAERVMTEKLLRDRNHLWMRQLDRMMASDKVWFVVVGSGHMVGPHGLPTLLKAKGYQVDRY